MPYAKFSIVSKYQNVFDGLRVVTVHRDVGMGTSLKVLGHTFCLDHMWLTDS